MIAAFISDLRTAWRSLMRAPAFLMTASAVLGLGLAATVFMLTVMNTFYLKPPPFRDSDRLYRVFGQHELTRQIQDELLYLDFRELRQTSSIEDAAAVSWTTAIITGGGTAQRFDGAEVSPNFFELLGASPLFGRTFIDRDGLSGAEPVAILSAEVWESQYGSARDTVGSRIVVNGEPRTIVGIAQPGFGLIGGESIWLPIPHNPELLQRQSDSARWVWMIAKAKAGIRKQEIETELRAVMARLQREHPRTNEALSASVLPIGPGIIGHASVNSLKRQLAGAYLTLLIACMTVAGLLFVRATYRQYETAMRSALGARRWRLIQLTLCEALIISAFGVAVAYCISVLALEYYKHLISEIGVYGGVPPWWAFEIDWRIGGISAMVALLSALLAGVIPAVEASRNDVGPLLRDRAHVTGSPRLTRFMSMMVIVELAAAIALLCGAMLLARGAYTAVGKNFGVDPDTVMTGSILLPESIYDDGKIVRLMDNVLRSMRTRPGVQGAALTTSLPGLGADRMGVTLYGQDERPVAELPTIDAVYVSEGFFVAMGRGLLAGREFDSRDSRGTPQVAVVNSEFAAKYFAGVSVLGKKIALPSGDGKQVEWLTIVGVADNILHSVTWGSNGSWRPTVYLPLAQAPSNYLSIVVRGGGLPADQVRLVKEVVASIDMDLPVYMLRPLARAQSETRAGYQLGSVSMLGFSIIAVILAIVGAYVVLSFTVQQRTKEIAIRRALGASNGQIVSAVVRGTAWQVAVGLTIGAALTPIAVNLVSSLMDGLQTREFWIYAAAFCVVGLAVAAASFGPASRALRIEPAILLRVE